jgi:aryl-alcohol dehydrogenase-like predicted oxidoreductase
MRTGLSLGDSSETISTIGLGCDKMFPGAREAEFSDNVAFALDCGVNFFDTAAIYGNGSNEEFLGRALAGRRHEAFICTKFGHLIQPDGRPGLGGRPEYVRKSCEESLRRLGTDHIDLYCQHLYDPLTPIEDTTGALVRLVEQGKIRHIGLSNVPVEKVKRAHAIHPIAAVQAEYSLWMRNHEAGLLPACRNLGIAFVGYWPLALGFLAGRVRNADDLAKAEHRALMIRGGISEESLAGDLQKLQVINAIAASHEATPAQIALAWIIDGEFGVIPIPGTASRRHLAENISAAGIILHAAEKLLLNAAFGNQ